MSRGLAPAVALAGVLAFTAACTGQDPDPAGAPAVPARAECGTLTLAVNPWDGARANAAVIGYLAETRLGCQVTETEMTAAAAWQGLAAGSVDAMLENWGNDELRARYIDQEQVAVAMGMSGTKGRAGWYVPPWMAELYPGVTNWKTLNQYVVLFRTPDTGELGQLLTGDQTFANYDAALVANLELDYMVVAGGAEDKMIEAFTQAEATRTPLLGYFSAPSWFLTDMPLAEVNLPAYRAGCDTDPAKVACGYRSYDRDKVANRAFAESGNPAADLIKNFQWNNDEQNELARLLVVNKLAPDAAAKKWLDANGDVWQDWLPQ